MRTRHAHCSEPLTRRYVSPLSRRMWRGYRDRRASPTAVAAWRFARIRDFQTCQRSAIERAAQFDHLDHHLFDTLYHAVALEEGAMLVTADTAYFAKAKDLGASSCWPICDLSHRPTSAPRTLRYHGHPPRPAADRDRHRRDDERVSQGEQARCAEAERGARRRPHAPSPTTWQRPASSPTRRTAANPPQRAEAQGYRYCTVAENLALNLDSRGFETRQLARKAVEGWKASPGHRANMLRAARDGDRRRRRARARPRPEVHLRAAVRPARTR